MRARKILNITFGVLIVSFGVIGMVDAFFPRFRNDLSCDDSAPVGAAQMAALQDARSRLPAECAASRSRCAFVIQSFPDADGRFRISPYVVETDFLEGCVYKDDRLDVFVYDREGKFLRTEGAPYG